MAARGRVPGQEVGATQEMINRNVVLILGAGASHAYGFPMGSELRDRIISMPGRNMITDYGVDLDPFEAFQRDFADAKEPSIDAFLETRAEHEKLGKLVIAHCIMRQENPDLIRRPRDEDWYEYLLGLMKAPTVDEFTTNQVTFITYNYDRSLEYCLFRAIRSRYGLSDSDAAQAANRFQIIHIHGQVGGLPEWHQPELNPYSKDFDWPQLRDAASSLTIVHEDIADNPLFARVHDALCKAEVVAFLGFGFHPANVSRLEIGHNCFRARRGIERETLGMKPAIVSGTLRDHTKDEAEYDVMPQFESEDVRLFDLSVLGFLREYRGLFSSK